MLLVLMIALYIISFFMHLFSKGHASLFLPLQLAELMAFGRLCLIRRLLCFEIMDLTLFMQLWLTLNVFLLKNLCSLCCVTTTLQKGTLQHHLVQLPFHQKHSDKYARNFLSLVDTHCPVGNKLHKI